MWHIKDILKNFNNGEIKPVEEIGLLINDIVWPLEDSQ